MAEKQRRISTVKLIEVIILLGVLAVVFGGGAYFAYVLFLKPAKLDKQAEIAEANAPEPTPTPDPSIEPFNAVIKTVEAGDFEASREALRDFISKYPDSTKLAEAKERLGQINLDDIYTATERPGKVRYTVQSGDALLKIASKTNSTAELIFRVNNLLSINLSIGQELIIPQPKLSIFIDRQKGTLTLLEEGNFFKEYKVVEMPKKGEKADAIDTKVGDKFAMRDDARVAFGTVDYVGSDRWLLLADGDLIIRSAPEPSPDGENVAMPSGIILARADMYEIFPLVNRDTPVTIQ